MNGSRAFTDELITAIVLGLRGREAAEVLVCPPFPYLAAAAAKLSGTALMLGAQNVSQHAAGAHTGEVAAAMLKDMGCAYVIVGHS
ncbi:MAG TPA: triose-phosphate isomerase, partial [Woeseiaceae bacterium]